jgi:hypothetical protein
LVRDGRLRDKKKQSRRGGHSMPLSSTGHTRLMVLEIGMGESMYGKPLDAIEGAKRPLKGQEASVI